MKEDRSREQEKLRPVMPRGKKLVFLALGLIQVRKNWRLNDFAGYSFFFILAGLNPLVKTIRM